ncbi:MAG TPA: S41 family peptidase [Allosphingosinicella sp.]|jgi:hypothetical protein
MILRALKWLGGALLLVLLGLASWDVATYDRKAWASDFERLKRDMAQGYANLDWVAQHRGVDLQRLSTDTARDLDSAHSRVLAWFALKRFIDRFNDPHLRVEDREGGASGHFVSSLADGSPTGGADCSSAGYEDEQHDFEFPFARLPGWRSLGGGSFPTGIAGTTGVIRIAQFGENKYLPVCERAFRPGLSDRGLQLATRRVLQQELRAGIAGLRQAGARRVLVDLTGNGGGSEWVDEVIALFTARALTRQAPRLVGPACDRAQVWEGRPPPCSVFRRAPPEPVRLRGTGEWAGSLLVLTDRDTASASENFVAWIKDGGAGRILGARTAGAGCGYSDGGTRTPLTVRPVDVRMPNCARFMKDGTNEIEGIAPHIELPMDEREKAAEALARLLSAR